MAETLNRLKLQFSVRTVDDGKPHQVMEAYVDGQSLTDFDVWAVHVPYGLLPSSEREGYWYILTCTCGDPGCGGIFYGFEVRHLPDRVTWHVPEPGPMRDYVFDKADYQREIGRVLEAGRRLAHDKTREYSFVPRENDLYFRGKLRDGELARIWDEAPNSVLAPWRTRYEPGDPAAAADRPAHLVMRDPLEILRNERRQRSLWLWILSPLFILLSTIIVLAMAIVWTFNALRKLVRRFKP